MQSWSVGFVCFVVIANAKGPTSSAKPDLTKLREQLIKHEGKRSSVYKDSLGIQTIGVGFNLERSDAKAKIEYDRLAKIPRINGRPLQSLSGAGMIWWYQGLYEQLGVLQYGRPAADHWLGGGILMATNTALMLVGSSHPYHGGILPTHQLWFSENSTPHWVSSSLSGPSGEATCWVPTPNNMIDDGLLMAALLASSDGDLCKMASQVFRRPYSYEIDMNEDVTEEDRVRLYAACRGLDSAIKVVLCVLSGSWLTEQLDAVKHYKFEIELCCAKHNR